MQHSLEYTSSNKTRELAQEIGQSDLINAECPIGF